MGAATVILTLPLVVTGPPKADSSSKEICRVSEPAYPVVGVYVRPLRAAFSSASVPLKVTLPVPLPLCVTPVVVPSVRVPWAAESVTWSVPPSWSGPATTMALMPDSTSDVFSPMVSVLKGIVIGGGADWP